MEKVSTVFLSVLIFFTSCGVPSEEKEMLSFFGSNNVDLTGSSVIILNPDFCGSCTDETIDWIINHDKEYSKKKYILTTGTIPEKYLDDLGTTSFSIVEIEEETIARLGVPPTASTHFLILDNRIIEETVIK